MFIKLSPEQGETGAAKWMTWKAVIDLMRGEIGPILEDDEEVTALKFSEEGVKIYVNREGHITHSN